MLPEKLQGPVVQSVDNAIQQINHYPADSCCQKLLGYLLNRDLFTGQHYPFFEQLGSGLHKLHPTGTTTYY